MDSKIEPWSNEFIKLWISWIFVIILRKDNLSRIHCKSSYEKKKIFFNVSYTPRYICILSLLRRKIFSLTRAHPRGVSKIFRNKISERDTLWKKLQTLKRVQVPLSCNIFLWEITAIEFQYLDSNAKPAYIGRYIYTGGRCYRRILKSHGKIPKHVESLITLAFHRLPFCLPDEFPRQYE